MPCLVEIRRAMFPIMGMRELLLILISFVLGLGCIHWLRLLDRYEREPFNKMVLVTVLGGGCASAMAWGLYEIIASFGFHDFQSYRGTLLVIGPVEELSKLMGLVSVYGIIRNELNEPADGIIYIACVALGFSLIENFLYASVPSREYLILARLLVGTPLHICFSALMGLSFYLWIKNRKAFHLVITAFILSSLSHGLYDLIVFNHYWVVLLAATLILMYGFTRNLFIYALAVSPHRISLAQTIDACDHPRTAEAVICPHCASSDAATSYAIAGATLYYCKRCDCFNTTRDGLFRLFYHYAGIFRQTAKRNMKPGRRGGRFLTLYQGNTIVPERKMAFFKLAQLNDVLEKLHYKVKNQMRSKWYLPDNLFQLHRPGAAVDYAKMVRDGKMAFWRRLVWPSRQRIPKRRLRSGGGAAWNWRALLLPELWYARHGLWGAWWAMAGVYLLAAYLAMSTGFSLSATLAAAALAMRLVSWRWGNRIYFMRYGRWP